MLLNQSLAFEVDVCALLVDIMVGRNVLPFPSQGKKCVGDMFLPLSDGVVERISSYDNLCTMEGVIGGEIKYKVGDTIQSKRQYTSCAGWVQITGGTANEVLIRMLKVYKRFEIVTS